MIIHTLKGQWDQIQGDSRAGKEKQSRFLRDWDHQELFFQRSDQSLQWRYSPPPWLFVHTQLITPLEACIPVCEFVSGCIRFVIAAHRP